eukprot:2729703-Alexandrium_andersonii.AAC.1
MSAWPSVVLLISCSLGRWAMARAARGRATRCPAWSANASLWKGASIVARIAIVRGWPCWPVARWSCSRPRSRWQTMEDA